MGAMTSCARLGEGEEVGFKARVSGQADVPIGGAQLAVHQVPALVQDAGQEDFTHEGPLALRRA